MKKLLFTLLFFFNAAVLYAQETITPVSELMKFGATGVFAVILMGYIYKMQKDHYKERAEHREERDEWRKDNNIQFAKLVEITEKIVSVVARFEGTLEAIHRELTAKELKR